MFLFSFFGFAFVLVLAFVLSLFNNCVYVIRYDRQYLKINEINFYAQTLTQTKQLQNPIKQAINTFHLTQLHANKRKTQ